MKTKLKLDAFRTRPYRNIFIALVVVFFADALAPAMISDTAVSDFVVIIILLAALVETVRTKRHAVLALVFGAPAIIARLVAGFRADSPAWNSTVIVLTALFFGFLIWNLLHDLLSGSRSTGERVYGALCAYLFIGILFSLVFAHMEYRFPGSFSSGNQALLDAAASEAAMMPVFTYFSFVTLTTLGYGDITPVAEHARTLAWLEALVGQLYLAVMIATLVGLKVSEARTGVGRIDPGAAENEGRDGDAGD
jgi:voltage-gated potassium channel